MLLSLLQKIKRRIGKNPLVFAVTVICLTGFYSFANIASEVLEGETKTIDTKILLLARNGSDIAEPLGPQWLQEAMRDLTALGGNALLTLITLAAFFYLIAVRKRGAALYLTVAVISGIIVSTSLKLGFDRPRPNLFPHGSYTYMPSFPSGHSIMSAIVYLTLGVLLAEAQPNLRLKIYIFSVAVCLTILVGISRIYLGVHWPSDVLAGWIGGLSWALLIWLLKNYGQNRLALSRNKGDA
jgi:undecaprenyl-diphosphatase